ncbi:hypothetical protein CERZMDRAFT_94536 [Cercospora zeae-maydis SCOH1-5]|uniref:Mitotic checkpoint regulator, MAD2B-interacting-domain-containing protein n=1 Tax=Cercospora zeae-maydis SCOH1-5 TaxID=717836 RepID=A0A6A6FP72_9PEZI|nr:hypothetical protein CERZMDRAFT_94536 [Cercospora zeae-maydis SCOH1-5]
MTLLVNYSDSEDESSNESVTPAPAAAPKAISTAKPAFQKAAPGKLQVSLPSLKPEPGQNGDEGADGPPTKRARTGGAFSGFNALLPAPKKPATAALKKGVNLKTSSEAAFSRNPLPQRIEDGETYIAPDLNDIGEARKQDELPSEPKLVGKATRFLPLSVSNKKKKKPLRKLAGDDIVKPTSNGTSGPSAGALEDIPSEVEPPKPKAKKSLFSVAQEEDDVPPEASTNEYESFNTTAHSQVNPQEALPPIHTSPPLPSNPSSLEAVAADLNLTAAQKRQLFGRNAKDIEVRHFDLDAQYAENERARAAGEVVEHRAVKAVAPGKHSLQQLVNNAQTQQDALKDKWAQGRRARGEGGSKYGWSTG